jgi:hypothetical protein
MFPFWGWKDRGRWCGEALKALPRRVEEFVALCMPYEGAAGA